MGRSRASEPDPRTWLLLIHAIPPRPNYLRIKIGRRLHGLGAVLIKNSVYALPANDETLEDLQWVAREIAESGGEASVVESRFLEGLTDSKVKTLFQAAREADYADIIRDAQGLRTALTEGRTVTGDLVRLRRRLSGVVDIDFFGADGREAAEALLADLESYMEPTQKSQESLRPRPDIGTGRTWVTRKGIKVDRIASAWLIRQFIDPSAKFKFVPGQGYRPEKNELRFDMFEAEYTHEGDRCTFEVLLDRFGLSEPALRKVSEVVHDIDLKDRKFGRAETAGMESLITGLATGTADDEARLAQGSVLFASLYHSFRSAKP